MNGELASDVADFLERLGRVVEQPREGRLVAKHRTALVEEERNFAIIDGPETRPLKRGINILGAGVPDLDPQDYPYSYRLHEFFDWTVNASMLTSDLRKDTKERSQDFVAQSLAQSGSRLDEHSLGYFLKEWLPDPDKRLLAVLGPAGYGKTMLTFKLAHHMADLYLDYNEDGTEPFPYLINFGEFRRLASFEGMILSSLQSNGITDYTASAFASLVTHNRVVLFLDGLDELLEERPEEAKKNLRELLETLEGRGKVVITARSTFFRTSDDLANFLAYYLEPSQVSVVDLVPFDQAQRRELISNRTKDGREQHRIETFIGDDALGEIMGSPLLLNETIDSLLLDKEARLDRTKGREDLLSALEESVYSRERVRQNHLYSNEVQRSFLKTLASELLRYTARGFDWEVVQTAALEAGEVEDDDPIALGGLAHHHFLIIKEDKGEAQFDHQVFREYFQARVLLDACKGGDNAWVVPTLRRRPLPEEVVRFAVELDRDRQIPKHLLGLVRGEVHLSAQLANNVASVCASYADSKLLAELFESVPADLPLELALSSQDLRDLRWSERYFASLKLVNVDLRGAVFDGTVVNELVLADTRVDGADVAALIVESISINFGTRIFGSVKALEELARLGADAGFSDGEPPADVVAEHEAAVRERIRSRLKRFYNAGQEGVADSKWHSSIQERNLLGGIGSSEIKYVKREIVPALLKARVIDRRRAHGLVIYDLLHEAEDDARLLIEKDELVGLVLAAYRRLVG